VNSPLHSNHPTRRERSLIRFAFLACVPGHRSLRFVGTRLDNALL
jgi:hypothetical protein